MRKYIRPRKNYGWAFTKKIPHYNHPAYFKKVKNSTDDITYVTFTHENPANIDGESVETIALNHNINKDDPTVSYVVPRVYEGTRSALGKGTNKFSLSSDDQATVDDVFHTAPHYPVPNKKKNGNNNLPF